MKAYITIFVFFLVTSLTNVLGSKQSRLYKPIGCFRDKGSRNHRPLPKLLANLRSKIDWYNLNKTIDHCSRLADKEGFDVFGLQFYGECWSGKDAAKSYGKDGKARNCVAGVGQEKANFVYRFVTKATQWTKSNYKFVEGDIISETSFSEDLATSGNKCKQRCETINGCKAVRLYDLGVGVVFCTFFSHVTHHTCPPDSSDFLCILANGESWEKVQA